MDITYVALTVLPESGMAEANRILDIAKGLCESGCSVNVLIPFSDKGSPESFYYNGVHCISLFNKPSGRMKRAFISRVLFPLYAYFALRRLKRQDVLVSYFYSVQLLLSFYLIAKLLRLGYVREVSEYPICVRHKSRFSWFGIRTFFELRVVPKLFDGMIVMTRSLLSFYRQLARRSCKLILLPMTVDCERFLSAPSVYSEFPYIAYCGSMTCDRKGMNQLVRAFEIASREYTTLHLVIIGDVTESLKCEMIDGVSEAAVRHIIFTGRIQRSKIPSYICNAKILALIRPANKMAEGGFPTKLGEYLATGRPVVVTRVGEIPEFLTDHRDVFFAEPDDVNSVRDCFLEILSNYNRALSIGADGQKTARKCFHYVSAGHRLSAFLEQFKRN